MNSTQPTEPMSLRTGLPQHIAELRKQIVVERAARITSEIDGIIEAYGSKLGRNAREIFAALVSDAKRGALDLKTVPARLIAFAEALPPEQRVRDAGELR